MSHFLYKIVTQADWSVAQTTGLIPLSLVDARDRFIHLSTASQFIATANLYFRATDQPLVIEFDSTQLKGEIRWEWNDQRQSEFPHLYATTLPLNAANAVLNLIIGDEGYTVLSRSPIASSNGQ